MLHREVSIAVHFMQLPRVALGGAEPPLQAFFEAPWGRCPKPIQIGGESQVVTHDIALHRPAHAANQVRWVAILTADRRKADLAATTRREVDAHRDTCPEAVRE